MRRSATAPVRILLALVTLVLASACATTGPPEPVGDDVVVTTAGPVRGSVVGELRRFRGIPYAAPPVGELRWRSPQPPAPWTEVRDATALTPSCPQSWQRGPDGTPQVDGDEDCLVVNVDTPLGADGPVPVMVFVHGGGFTSGQGAPYDAARVVTQGRVVVVTLNYRLGALGFLDHPAIDDPAVGNFGLADQQAALRWVRDNIAAFGGDPGNVTLWGESAGAFSTCTQVVAPGARGLFHRAIVQSGPCANAVLTRDVAEQRGTETAAELGCGDPATAMQCLRAVPPERLVTVYPEDVARIGGAITDLHWYPVAGTPTLPDQPIDAIRAGTAADVPLIHGTTRDEARWIVAQNHDAQGAPVTAESYPQILTSIYGDLAPAIVAEYPADSFSSPGLALATVLGDHGAAMGTCTQFPVLDAPARTAPTFAYEFVQPVQETMGDFPLGTPHGADVPFFFDSGFPGAPPASRAPEEDVLAGRLIDYWTTFARTGEPGPGWPAYRDGGVVSISADGTVPVDVAAEHRCGFWNEVAPV